MLKKASIMVTVIAVLGLAVVASADARGGHRGGHVSRGVHVSRSVHVSRNVHVGRNVHVKRNVRVNRTVRVNRAVHGRYVVGRTYNGRVWFGRRRHFWHGRWYAYGVGPCWIYIDGLWFWNLAVCPL